MSDHGRRDHLMMALLTASLEPDEVMEMGNRDILRARRLVDVIMKAARLIHPVLDTNGEIAELDDVVKDRSKP